MTDAATATRNWDGLIWVTVYAGTGPGTAVLVSPNEARLLALRLIRLADLEDED